MTASDFTGGNLSDKGIVVWKNCDEGHSVYPEEMVPDIVLAKTANP